MYEEQTYELILERILSRMPDTVDKRESSFLYNASAPIAIELQNMYLALDNILNITYFDTSDRNGKLQRCRERGIDITQFEATYAICELHIEPSTLSLSKGTRFNYGDLNFSVTEKISNGAYYIQCDTSGTVGNVTGEVTPIDYVAGLESAVITDVYQWGEDEAEETQIDSVYYSSLNSQAYGGNRADYIAKMKSIAGVGGVKVYSASEWNGGGTCKLVFSTSSHTKPSESFVDSIQTIIDPVTNQGAGYGIAPIGHTVTVAGVNETTVNVSMDLTLQTGYAWEDISEAVNEAVNKYFESLNSEWDSLSNIIVRISQIETRILDVAGVIDITNTKLNGEAVNFTVEKDSLVIKGEVNATV